MTSRLSHPLALTVVAIHTTGMSVKRPKIRRPWGCAFGAFNEGGRC
jgi:hypothetical protein